MSHTLHPTGSGAMPHLVDPASTHRRLRTTTAPVHERTEALLDAPHRCERRDTYHELLQWFAAVHEVLEPALRALDQRLGGRLDTARRGKLAWLRADLAALGGSPARTWGDAVRTAVAAVHVDGVPAAVGLQYVLEGSTLGGRMLAAIAGRELCVDRHSGGRFLHGYGTATGRWWREWWHGVPQLVGRADLPTLEDSAHAAFAALEVAATALARTQDGRRP